MSTFLAPVIEEEEVELEQTLRPRRLDDFVGQERVKEQLAIALAAAQAAARRSTTCCSSARRARQDEPRVHRPRGARRRHPHGRRPCARAQGRHRRDPHRARAARRPLRRRDPPAQPRDRGDPLSGARGLPPRHRRRAGRGGAHADARPAAVHAHRRDDAHGPAHDAAARPLRHDVPARLLRAGRARVDRPPLGAHHGCRGRRRRGRGDRVPLARHAARREPDPASRARRRAGAPPGRDHERDRARGARAARGGRARPRPRGARAAALDRREVRRRPGRPVDARRVPRRGAGHDRGRLRAVPAAARLHPAHAARAHDHEARTRASRHTPEETSCSRDRRVPRRTIGSVERLHAIAHSQVGASRRFPVVEVKHLDRPQRARPRPRAGFG